MNDFENLIETVNSSGPWVAIMHPVALQMYLDELETMVEHCRHWYWRLWYWLRCRWTKKDTAEMHVILRRFGRE